MSIDQTPIESLFGKEGADRILRQAQDLWWEPEIERRKNAGTIDANFTFSMAQALFRPDDSVEIRFNEEVRGVAYVRASRSVEKGDYVYPSDLDGLESFDLVEEDLDCGHFTMIKVTGGWFLSFNFLRSRSLCATLLNSAKDFLDVARYSIQQKKSRPAVDNLYSACELISKAQLILTSMLNRSAKSHRAVSTKINQWRHFGNIDSDYVDLFNRLGTLRPSCRYDGVTIDHTLLSEEEFELVEAQISRLEQMCLQLPPHDPTDVDPNSQTE